MRSVRVVLLAMIAIVMLVMPSAVYPCGPYFYEPVFVTPGPADDAKYAAGEIGIPLRSYGRLYVFIAYRYFDGEPLSKEERTMIFERPGGVSTFGGGTFPDQTEKIIKPWVEARAKVHVPALNQKIDIWKPAKEYQSFLNCTPNAFENAARTLNERGDRYGFDSVEVKNWATAQDLVFAQCSGATIELGGNPIRLVPPPDPAPDSAALWLKQDRAYPSAAANFYAGYFDNAIAGFRAIAADKQSPWRVWGKFLVGRSLIRKATLNVEREDEPFDPKVLEQAETELREVVADPELAPVHEAAQQMLGFTNFRLHPAELQTRLATDLATRTTAKTMAREIGDYVKLLGDDRLEPKDDMSDWIQSFERLGTTAPDAEVEATTTGVEAVNSWKEKRTLPWLVLAISAAQPADQGVKEVVAEAEKVKSDSPAYATVRYHLARLAFKRGDLAGVRKVTENFLTQQGEHVPLSTKNMFLRLRLRVATDFSDFMKYAQRRPVAVGSPGFDEMTDICKKDTTNTACAEEFLDPMAAKQLDWTPLSYWMTGVNTLKPGSELRQEMALATWTRAVIAQDWRVADQMVRVIEKEVKGSDKYLDPFLKSGDPSAKTFAAAFAMLHWPGIQPTMNAGSLRDDPLQTINNYRMNWWCTPEIASKALAVGAVRPVFASFLRKSDQEAGERQENTILSQSIAPNYLVPIVVAWAKGHPDDPRVPEALALAVKATRFGCTDAHTTDFSKAAFGLLHSKYPQSEWAKKTKYYY